MAERAAALDAVRAALDVAALRMPAEIETMLAAYVDLLARWRRRRSIAGPRGVAELAIEAVGDALMAHRAVPAAGTLLDVGSGAGIPGIALALVAPQRRVALVESSAARAGLLRSAAATLGAENIDVVASRAEDLAHEIAAGRAVPADAAISRAFLPPDEWIDLARSLVRPDGVVAVMASARWPGPAPGTPWVVRYRREYRLPRRKPRAVWALGLRDYSASSPTTRRSISIARRRSRWTAM